MKKVLGLLALTAALLVATPKESGAQIMSIKYLKSGYMYFKKVQGKTEWLLKNWYGRADYIYDHLQREQVTETIHFSELLNPDGTPAFPNESYIEILEFKPDLEGPGGDPEPVED